MILKKFLSVLFSVFFLASFLFCLLSPVEVFAVSESVIHYGSYELPYLDSLNQSSSFLVGMDPITEHFYLFDFLDNTVLSFDYSLSKYNIFTSHGYFNCYYLQDNSWVFYDELDDSIIFQSLLPIGYFSVDPQNIDKSGTLLVTDLVIGPPSGSSGGSLPSYKYFGGYSFVVGGHHYEFSDPLLFDSTEISLLPGLGFFCQRGSAPLRFYYVPDIFSARVLPLDSSSDRYKLDFFLPSDVSVYYSTYENGSWSEFSSFVPSVSFSLLNGDALLTIPSDLRIENENILSNVGFSRAYVQTSFSIKSFINHIGQIFTSAVSWVSDVGAAILAQPLLLAFTALPLCGLGIAVFRRLKETV